MYGKMARNVHNEWYCVVIILSLSFLQKFWQKRKCRLSPQGFIHWRNIIRKIVEFDSRLRERERAILWIFANTNICMFWNNGKLSEILIIIITNNNNTECSHFHLDCESKWISVLMRVKQRKRKKNIQDILYRFILFALTSRMKKRKQQMMKQFVFENQFSERNDLFRVHSKFQSK